MPGVNVPIFKWREASALIAVAALAHFPLVRGDFIWDDHTYILENNTLRNLDGLRRIWFEMGATPQYYPLVHTTFWMEYHLWKLNPVGYHVDNIALHALNAVALWLVLRRLAVPGAWLAAAVFAVHPVEVESIGWIAERKNLLSAFFYLMSLSFYIRFGGLEESRGELPSRREGKHWLAYGAAFVLFLCALWSKTVTCTFPVAIMLLIWWRRGRISFADIVPLIPFFFLGLLMGLLTARIEREQVGASGKGFDWPWVERFLIAGRAAWFYPGKLASPVTLSFFYSRWRMNSSQVFQFAYPIGGLAVLTTLWLRRGSSGRGPLAAALFYLGTLFPALGFVNVYPMRFSYVADHFQYLAGIGLFVVLAGFIRKCALFLERAHPLGAGKTWPRALPAGIIVLLGATSFSRGVVYRSEERLWRDTIRKNPTSPMAYYHLGMKVSERGDAKEGFKYLQRALELDPDNTEAHHALSEIYLQMGHHEEYLYHLHEVMRIDPVVYSHLIEHWEDTLAKFPEGAEGHRRLAELLTAKGDFEGAAGHYAEVTRINPTDASAQVMQADALVHLGKTDEARSHYETALEIEPDNAAAHNGLGNLLTQIGELDEAETQFVLAMRFAPDSAQIRNNMGIVLRLEGKLEESAVRYREAIKLRAEYPDAHYNLGFVLVQMGRDAEGIAEYEAALRLRPEFPEAHFNWANALVRDGKIAEAETHYAKALEISPNFARAEINWGIALAGQKRFKDAEQHFSRALQIDPGNDAARENLRLAQETLKVR